jgi:hypothetical protein
VTHPFHPWHGRTFLLVECRQTWGEDRVYVTGDDGRLRHLPAGWTDVARDPFVVVSAGRAFLRMADLLALTDLLADPALASTPGRTLSKPTEQADGCQANSAAYVR